MLFRVNSINLTQKLIKYHNHIMFWLRPKSFSNCTMAQVKAETSCSNVLSIFILTLY